MQDWTFQASETLYSGTKVFVDAVAAPDGTTTQTMPNIGDPWDGEWSSTTLKNIRVSYTGNRPSCPRRYECYYDSNSIDSSIAGGDPKRLPVSMQIGGEFKNAANMVGKGGEWFWKDSTLTCGTSFFAPIMVPTKTISIVRYIYGSDLDRWSKYTDKMIYTVNDAAFWPAATGVILIGGGSSAEYEFPKETLLYCGADLTEHTNNPDSRRWEATLKFQAIYNTNDGTTPLGWNYEWNSDSGKWDKPQHQVNGAGDWLFAYRLTNFPVLFSTGAATFIPNSAFPTL